ncbi:TRAP transporter small permease subunit [Roseovarius amoyensis]|uniref:TRAP transporter small permease subunit n=1 Tax=Roseovarius amoyensis TaxID=2211448 RepID=UPI000DBE21D2|nr:TRAP transporter small permease [Roseovarius amoyensis]
MAPSSPDQPEAVPPSGWLQSISNILRRIEDILNDLAGWLILALMAVGVLEVISRSLFNRPIPGQINFVELSLVAIAFLGLSHCQRSDGHIRMTLLTGQLKGRTRHFISIAMLFVGLATLSLLVWSTFTSSFLPAWTIGDVTNSTVRFPVWPTKLLVPAMLALVCLRILITLIQKLRMKPGVS